MPDTKKNPLTPGTPRQLAIVGTVLVMMLILGGAGIGFWYGTQNGKTTTTTTPATNTSTPTTNTSVAANSLTAISGTISQITKDGIEVAVVGNVSVPKVLATITDATSLRKFDYRSIPKNGFGDGTPIQKTDLKVGASVVVATAGTVNEKVDAQKVSLLIYP